MNNNNADIMNELQQFREEINERMDNFEKKQNEMLSLLKGNEINAEDRGMIGKVNSHGKRILSLEKFKDRGIYLIVGISIGTGGGLGMIISKIFFHN